MRKFSRLTSVALIGLLSGCQTIDDVTELVSSGVSVVKEQFTPSKAEESPASQSSAPSTLDLAQGNEPSKMVSGSLPNHAVVDGDTIHLVGRKIRLFGIDAPELSQTCTAQGKDMPCGITARNALIGFTAGADITCVRQDTDKYGRDVSLCFAGDVDVSAAMVRSGMAVAYRKYSQAYVTEEKSAKSNKRGMWAGTFTMPWDWRAQRRN